MLPVTNVPLAVRTQGRGLGGVCWIKLARVFYVGVLPAALCLALLLPLSGWRAHAVPVAIE